MDYFLDFYVLWQVTPLSCTFLAYKVRVFVRYVRILVALQFLQMIAFN